MTYFFLLVIASDSVAIPVSKACGIYSVLYSDGLPRSLRSLAMTQFISLPPSGKVARSADRGSYVILSGSEISHDQREESICPISSSVGFFTSFRMTCYNAFSFGVNSPAETGEMSRQRQKGRVRSVGEVARSADRG